MRKNEKLNNYWTYKKSYIGFMGKANIEDKKERRICHDVKIDMSLANWPKYFL